MTAAGPARKRWRLKVALGALTLALAAAGLLGYAMKQPPPPRPPAIDLADAEPEVAAAVRAARGRVEGSPRSAQAWGRLGKVLAAHGLWEAAGPCFAEAERLEPDEPRWPYFRALGLTLGEPQRAIGPLRRAAELAGRRQGPRLRLAELLLAQGSLEEAESVFRSLAVDEPDQPLVHLGLARLAWERDDAATALEHLRRCGDSSWTRKAAASLLAEVYRRQGDTAAAERAARQAARLPDDAEPPDPYVEELDAVRVGRRALLSRASTLLGQDRTSEALALLGRAVADWPDSASVWLGLGRGLVQAGDVRAAETALHRAARLAPGLVEAWFYLGVARFGQNDPAGAAAYFRRAVELRPDHGVAWYNLGQCLDRQGDRRGAVAALRAAVRHKPHHAQAHAALGRLLAREGDAAGAARHLTEAVELDPEDREIRKLLDELRPGR